jgi:chemotaxis protein CheD
MIAAPEILPDLNLNPGELYLSRTPAILRTILGSCVSATFFSKRLGAGAMCHGVLPRWPRQSPVAEGPRYVDFSIRYLIREFESIGARRDQIEVKLFGGADVLPVAGLPNRATVGAQNCSAARETLEEEGLILAAWDLGGIRGRRIHFHTGTGEVLLHRLAVWSEQTP